MFVYFIIILSRSQQFPTSSSQNQIELGEWHLAISCSAISWVLMSYWSSDARSQDISNHDIILNQINLVLAHSGGLRFPQIDVLPHPPVGEDPIELHLVRFPVTCRVIFTLLAPAEQRAGCFLWDGMAQRLWHCSILRTRPCAWKKNTISVYIALYEQYEPMLNQDQIDDGGTS